MEELKGIMKRPVGQEMPKIAAINGATYHERPRMIDMSLTRYEHPADQNLLKDSWSAKLNQVTPPKEVPERANGSQPWRSSADNVFGFTQPREELVSNEVFENIRRHQRVKKNMEWSRKKQAKLRERLMTWASDSERYLPDVVDGGDAVGQSETSSVSRDKIRFDDFPRQHGSSVVSSSSYLGADCVRVVKKDGVFRPVDKYGKPRARRITDDLPYSNTLLDYETVAIKLKWATEDETDHPNVRKKKGLSVSFSAKSESIGGRKSDKESRHGSVRSFSCEPKASRKRELLKSRKNLEQIGVRWDVPDTQRTYLKYSGPPDAEKCRTRSGPSRNLIPVTSAMYKERTATEYVRWNVDTGGRASDRMNCAYNIQGSLRALRKMTDRANRDMPSSKPSFSDTLDPSM